MVIISIILLILGEILIIVGITVDFENDENEYYTFCCGVGILFSVFIMGITYSLSIHPIDVYRGKTTLEITYKDNIPIDSVVVYKK